MLNDGQSTHGTYLPILIPRVVRPLKRSMMTPGNNGVVIYNVVPDLGNGSASDCDITRDGRNGCISIRREFLLEAGSQR